MSLATNAQSRGRKITLTMMAILAIPLSVLYTSYEIESRPLAEVSNETVALLEVSTVRVEPLSYFAEVNAHGEARPRFELSLLAEVAGRVTAVSGNLAAGREVATASVLANIEPSEYIQALERAKHALYQAELTFLQEQQEAEQAKVQWQRANISDIEATELLLRKPQLLVAKAQVSQAEAGLQKAQKDLANTQISAPFSAVVVEREISLGQHVNVGDTVATLYSTQRVDVKLSLPINQWQLLPERAKLLGQSNVVLSNEQGQQWLGTITEVGQHIEQSNRQKQLVVSVFNPLTLENPLYPGTFLSASVPGKRIDNLLSLPASSLTGNGEIWYVDKQQQLQNFTADVAYAQNGRLYVKAPSNVLSQSQSNALTVLIHVSPSYLPGQKVVAVDTTESRS